MKNKIEFDFETKSLTDDGVFSGYGSVFHVVDGVKDVVEPGAFKKSLSTWKKKNRMPGLFWQHDTGKPIGVYTDMKEDVTGLWVEGQLLKNDVQQAKEAYALMKAGAITGLSIGFNTIVDEYDRESGVNTIKEVDLWEVSLVSFPCNDAARVQSVKSIETERDLEQYLREVGATKSEAGGILAKAREIYYRREADKELVEIFKNNLKLYRS